MSTPKIQKVEFFLSSSAFRWNFVWSMASILWRRKHSDKPTQQWKIHQEKCENFHCSFPGGYSFERGVSHWPWFQAMWKWTTNGSVPLLKTNSQIATSWMRPGNPTWSIMTWCDKIWGMASFVPVRKGRGILRWVQSEFADLFATCFHAKTADLLNWNQHLNKGYYMVAPRTTAASKSCLRQLSPENLTWSHGHVSIGSLFQCVFVFTFTEKWLCANLILEIK